MAKKANSGAGDDDRGKGTSTKALLGVAALALLGGGYLVTSGGAGAGADAPAQPAAAEAEAAPVAGAVVPLEPITLNLADGRFLKVALALQLVEGVPAPTGDAVAAFAAPALDEAISLLGSLSYPDLVAPGGRDHAKASLSERIGTRYEGDVMGVYFTELVMQ